MSLDEVIRCLGINFLLMGYLVCATLVHSETEEIERRNPISYGKSEQTERRENMQRGLYRKLPKKKCIGCDNPAYAPCRRVDPNRACTKCMKLSTQRPQKKRISADWDE